MSLVKIPFLAASVVSTYVALTPPTPMVPANQRPKNASQAERFFSAVVRAYNSVQKTLVCSSAVLEGIVILARQWPSHPLSQQVLTLLIRGPHALADRIVPTSMFFVGCGLAIIGGLVRYQCYRTLGRMFTYEVAIHDDHKLVTSGPDGDLLHHGQWVMV
ncbi:uncharacterized protein FIBRA_03369 [Fibroporia radiculosa]|uniref:Uncharacterized protein n=1 Tax=Fibroporia radiculosa TaxID=599839 RepID=J4GNF9_9APHY|nr:uncharacterized protein FIBRA_03369 [Fibroporia radiculosa]CCM01320.1 predicted protein [Fibroporia radiculosa]